MTLTTQCPYCKTSFRVTEAQLAQHNGSVRCGVCSQVFNGHDYLQQAEDDPTTAPLAAEPSLPDTQPVNDDAHIEVTLEEEVPDINFDITPVHQETLDFVAENRKIEQDKQQEPELLEESVDHNWDMQTDHALTVTQPVEEIHIESTSSEHSSEPTLVIDEEKDAQNDFKEETSPVLHDALIATTAAAPNFIEKSKSREKRRRILNWALSLFSVVLLLGLLIQAAYYWRHQIIASFPASQAIYLAACKKLHCTIGLATQIDDLSLESNDLQAVPDEPNTYQLSILIKNNSNIPQTWPNIELSLNNQSNTTLVRKVFTPKEYLGLPELINGGILNQTEQPVTIKFALPENVTISGYQVYLYYP